jgi:hypothetical protein
MAGPNGLAYFAGTWVMMKKGFVALMPIHQL